MLNDTNQHETQNDKTLETNKINHIISG